MYNLDCIYNTSKSFYNKAKIEIKGKTKILYSYDTKVAEIKNKKVKVYNLQSNSTLKHVKEFLLQEGFKAENKKQIEKDYFIK